MSNANDFVIENGVLKKYVGLGEIVTIPDSVKTIGDDAFDNCENPTIHAPAGSYAETYSKEHMSGQRKIKPVTDNQDKQRTYREHKGRYKRAMENEFFFEALLIDYALLEDRLRSMIYHMGFLKDRTAFKIWKEKAACLQEIVSSYKNIDENCQLGITSISGKMKIIRCVVRWAAYTESGYQQDPHLVALKSQCEGLDSGGILSSLDELQDWCAYRNEVIHGLMNKNLESLTDELKVHAEKGMQLAAFFDNQEKLLKKGNRVRKSANLQMK